tara:strand:- start:648 stop:932 length:285 start_codon:yes stop_codon:yes gene_type:complete
MTINKAAKKVNLKGVKRGEATAVAIIALPGRTSRSGSETIVKISLEKGSIQMKTTTTDIAIINSLLLSSIKWDSKVPSANSSSSDLSFIIFKLS